MAHWRELEPIRTEKQDGSPSLTHPFFHRIFESSSGTASLMPVFETVLRSYGSIGIAFLLWGAAIPFGILTEKKRVGLLLMPFFLGGGSVASLCAALIASHPRSVYLPFFFLSTRFDLFIDPLSRWFLGIIGAVGIGVSIYSPGYFRHLRKRVTLGFVWSALSLLFLSMTLVTLARNAIAFMVAWEMMALSSFALVATDHERISVRHAALIYLGATRTGAAFLMAGFLWAYALTGTWVFSAWTMSGSRALGPALLIFIGLATKAGCWPFHLWLPVAHPAAPAPVSAVMSGVMIKTPLYAMIRFLVIGPLFHPALGPLALAFGAVSAFWGVLFALLQHDLKRFLAYSSIENVGIILMGVGAAMIGRSLRLPFLYQIGLAAALFHALNHAIFKSLLFFGAGAIDANAHTLDMERLGGLIRRMPWTAAAFIVGSAAACALPPLNGFASEWLLYQTLLHLAFQGATTFSRLCGSLLVGWLALAGALALACFVKAVGIAFLGVPRSRQAASAREGSAGMVSAQVGFALACVALGLIAPLVQTAQTHGLRALNPAMASPVFLSAPSYWVLAAALGTLIGVIYLWMAFLSRSMPPRRFITWECGFGDLTPRTQYTATSFAQPIARIFGAFYRYDIKATIEGRDRRRFPDSITVESTHEPYLETRLYAPILRFINRSAESFMMRLQAGSVHQYLVFIALALGALLWLGSRY
jgi:hydrogenase-4 component B